MVPLTVDCIVQAAEVQQIPPAVLVGILRVEGGRVGQAVQNRNGSFDLGPMQINDRTWVPLIARAHFGGNQDAARIALRDHGCYNMHIGAWIYRQLLDRHNGNHGEAIGRYHSATPHLKQAYQMRFVRALSSMVQAPVNQQNQQTASAR